MADFRETIEAKIGADLDLVGAKFLAESRRDMGGGYYKDICFYEFGASRTAIESSYHDGLNCRVSSPGETELSTFDSWPTLWELTGMTAQLPRDNEVARNPNAVSAYLDLFPSGYDDFLRFIGAKLCELSRR